MGPAGDSGDTQAPVPGWFADCMILLIACFVGVIVYSNTVSGEFVLDDNYQSFVGVPEFGRYSVLRLIWSM